MDPHSAASMRFCHVLITGPPGIGKTTVCKKVVSLIERNGLSCDGFFTEETRSSDNKRIGFDVVRVKHPEFRLPIARATQILEPKPQIKTKYRVGKYAVFVENFEQVALPVFQTDSDVLLVDEIGKMELFSKSFTEKVNDLVFGEEGKRKTICMLATIPEVAPAHLLRKLRSNPQCKIFEVRYENRDGIPDEISKLIIDIVKN